MFDERRTRRPVGKRRGVWFVRRARKESSGCGSMRSMRRDRRLECGIMEWLKWQNSGKGKVSGWRSKEKIDSAGRKAGKNLK